MKEINNPGQEDESSFPLPLENELLMLKLKAEFGAECTTGTQDIPPAVINEFLKSVYEFEQKFREARAPIRIFDKTGKPFFWRAEEMGDAKLSKELKRIIRILQKHRLELDVLGQYPDRTIYRFITEEFFNYEMEDLDLPGYTHHFCYEEFHPNHEMDIRQRAVEFLTQWFEQKISEYSWQLGDSFILPDTRMFSKKDILRKISNLFEAYISFTSCEYRINDIRFEWNEQKQCGTGYVEGVVKYNAMTEAKELVHFHGPFRFYLSNSGTWWSIFYFVFPGFVW